MAGIKVTTAIKETERTESISVSDPILADLMDQLANRLQAHGEVPASRTLSCTMISIRSLVPMTRRT